jgi:hypothetical protein
VKIFCKNRQAIKGWALNFPTGALLLETPEQYRARLLRGRLISRPLAYARGTVFSGASFIVHAYRRAE